MLPRGHVALAAGLVVAAVWLTPALASAQSGDAGCGGGGGLGTAQVTIEQPAADTVISGKGVVVAGSARSSLGQLSRVEMTLAGVTKVQSFSPSGSVDFYATFDVSNVPTGPTTLHVVACGGSSLTGSLARGDAEMRLRVQAPPATPTTAARPTTTGLAQPVAAEAGGTTTTMAVTTTSQAAASSTSTTMTSTPAAPERPVTAKTAPARPRAGEAPLVLRDAPDDGSSRPPLWVGAVVGVSGALGLLFSAVSSRRRNRVPEAAEAVEPAESDLVDVR